MDKQKNNTITIKINGETKSYREEIEKGLSEEWSAQVTGTKPSPGEYAAALEAEEESFEWILPEEEPGEPKEPKEYIIKEAIDAASIYPKQSKAFQTKRLGPARPIILSIVFAVLVGITFGAGMLKLVLTDGTIKPAGVPDASQTAKAGTGETTKKSPFTLPPISAFVVQEGIYTTEESAKLVQKDLGAKGIPGAVLDKDGQAMLLVGIAGSLEGAKEIGAGLEGKGIEIYAKELTLPGNEASKVTAEEKAFLEMAGGIFSKLSEASAAALAGSGTVDAAGALGVLDSIDSKKFSDDKLIKLHKELGDAAASIAAYSKAKEPASLQEAQQHLLDFLSIYQAL